MNASDMLRELSAPFPRDQISWRAQTLTKDGDKALALAYIDARDVMDRLDEVFGPAGWQCDYPHAAEKTVCRIGILLDGEWIWKANGAGNSDIEAEKGALSDAFKRAAVCWGVGRYLYSLESPWVPCESYEAQRNGKTVKVWKRWTADPWKSVRNADAVSPPSRSAQSLKRTDGNGQDAWDRLVAALHSDGLSCKTANDVAKLRADYRAKARDERWPGDWLKALKDQFDAIEERVGADGRPVDDADHFPGDMDGIPNLGVPPITNGKTYSDVKGR